MSWSMVQWDYQLPLEWWIGRGLPLSLYLRGVVIARIRDGMKLKHLTLPPLEMFLCGEPEAHIAENTAYRHWMNNVLENLVRKKSISQPIFSKWMASRKGAGPAGDEDQNVGQMIFSGSDPKHWRTF
ncbi:Aspartic peptidase domain protein [Raphanus sativus]|nr:Aspartic peptidase domain protein [Raphanus sativus]